MDFYLSESNQLTCYGNVDIPQFLRISIEKNNVTLNVTDSNKVQLNTKKLLKISQFGMYKCVIFAEDISFEKTILLRNKGIVCHTNK